MRGLSQWRPRDRQVAKARGPNTRNFTGRWLTRTTFSLRRRDASPKVLKLLAGFEAVTIGLEGRCSIRRSYGTAAVSERALPSGSMQGRDGANVNFALRMPGIIRGLHPEPDRGTIAEHLAKAGGHGRRYRLLLTDDIVELLGARFRADWRFPPWSCRRRERCRRATRQDGKGSARSFCFVRTPSECYPYARYKP